MLLSGILTVVGDSETEYTQRCKWSTSCLPVIRSRS